jgi:hypothetical protein
MIGVTSLAVKYNIKEGRLGLIGLGHLGGGQVNPREAGVPDFTSFFAFSVSPLLQL